MQIPINKDGSAGTQKVVLDVFPQDFQMDAVYFDDRTNTVYATNDNDQFNALINFIFNGGPFYPPLDGHQIYAADASDPNNIHFTSILNDPVLGVTTGVINGIDKKNNSTLYIDVFGSVEGATTPKIETATPINN